MVRLVWVGWVGWGRVGEVAWDREVKWNWVGGVWWVGRVPVRRTRSQQAQGMWPWICNRMPKVTEPVQSPADSNFFLNVNRSPVCGVQTLVDTALESSASALSKGVSMSA